MRLLALVSIVMLVFLSCRRGKDVPAPESRDAGGRPALTMISCPVEGTPFVRCSGVSVPVEDRMIEVCSPGCGYRLEENPEQFLAEENR